MEFDNPLQAIREGLQFAPVEIRKAAVPALDRVDAILEDLADFGRHASQHDLRDRAKALLGRD